MSTKTIHNKFLLAVLCLIAVAALVSLINYLTLDKEEEIIQGEIEVNEYRVSTKVPSRILDIRVKEGDFVHKGDTLVILDAPELKAKKVQAENVREAASAINEKADNGAREEIIQGAFELLQQAKAAYDIASKTYTRLNNLYDEGVVTAQRRDEALAYMESAEAQMLAAQSQYDLARNGARLEERKAASAQVDRAGGAVMEVDSHINETVQVSQFDGEVIEVFPKEGELTGAGSGIMSIAIKDDLWGTFIVSENQLSGMKIGDELTVFCPATGKDIRMKIYFIKDYGSYSAWKSSKSTSNYDMKKFMVKARPTGKFEGLRSGMSLVLKR